MADQPSTPDTKSAPDQTAVYREALVLLARGALPLVGLGSRAPSLGAIWLVGLVALVGGLLLAPPEASKEFFSAIAGVIPVLLLTLAVQARFFELPTWSHVKERFELTRKPKETWGLHYLRVVVQTIEDARPRWRFVERILVGLALLVLLTVGEFAALHPLATGRATDGNPRLVYAAVAAGFAMIAGLSLIGGVESRESRELRSEAESAPPSPMRQ